MEIILARGDHLAELAILFDLYRVFYQQASDLKAAKKFLQERFQANESTIFIAREDYSTVGFTQLYPSFSSLSMQRILILNDLFVHESHRQKGVAKLLIQAAIDYAKKTRATRISLSTQISNLVAQTLYESIGFVRDKDFYYYTLKL